MSYLMISPSRIAASGPPSAASGAPQGKGPTPAAAQHVFTMGCVDSWWGGQGYIIQRLAGAVNYDTGGAISFSIHPSGELGDEPVIMEGLKDGTIDMAALSTTKLAPLTKVFTVLDVPFMFAAPADMLDFLYASPTKHTAAFEAMLEQAGKDCKFHILTVSMTGRRDFVSRKPVTSVDDIVGLKMRLMANPVHLDAWEAAGAHTMTLPWGEVYTSLQTGTIDAAEMTGTDYLEESFGEVAPYWMGTNHITFTSFVAISNKAWDSLASEQQSILKADAVSDGYLDSNMFMGLSDSLLRQIKQSAKVMTFPTDEELTKLKEKVLPAMLDKYSGDIGMDVIAALGEKDAVINKWYSSHK